MASPNQSHCYVYLMEDLQDGSVKIGVSVFPTQRAGQVEASWLTRVAVRYVFRFKNQNLAYAAEFALHKRFARQRKQAEWFIGEVDSFRDVINQMFPDAVMETGDLETQRMTPAQVKRFASRLRKLEREREEDARQIAAERAAREKERAEEWTGLFLDAVARGVYKTMFSFIRTTQNPDLTIWREDFELAVQECSEYLMPLVENIMRVCAHQYPSVDFPSKMFQTDINQFETVTKRGVNGPKT